MHIHYTTEENNLTVCQCFYILLCTITIVYIIWKAGGNDEKKKKRKRQANAAYKKVEGGKRKIYTVLLLWILNCHHLVSKTTSNIANISRRDF